MPLFQQSVLKKYLSELNNEKVSVAWKTFQSHFGNLAMQAHIRELKEEQYQEGFLRDLFVQVLGYTLNPQPGFNLTTEFKNEKDSKKADGVILLKSAVRAIVELKGTDTTDLSKIEGQAFGYLSNHKGCTYVVTSNFEKLRFYIQDATEHIDFNLFTLSKDEFEILYLCLNADSLLADVPLQVKQQSLTKEDAITKQLYADYKAFKRALYGNLIVLNPEYDKLQLFKKTQKLLDRFLFILFAEDRLLLPPNFIVKIVEEHKQLQRLRMKQSLYERFKIYFTDLLKGNKEEDIFAYNGGLFEPDDILDNLTLDDDILQDGVLKLSSYDYNTEVDVNILGHIFEHSLNELENLQASIENSNVDKTKSRRKKEGVFYTPRYITRYIVEHTVGLLCSEMKAALGIVEEDYSPAAKKNKASEAQRKALVQKLDDYRSWLLGLTICDPACGSGAFLNAALEFLITEHNYIDELINKLMGASIGFSWTPNDILEHNLFGVDVNEEAVEIARLSLWLRTAQKGRKLSKLSDNIKVGNSLIDDEKVAGDKAFIWNEKFPEVFHKGGFDVVIGNPPYGASLSRNEKNYFDLKYLTTQYNYDTYKFFFEKSYFLLKTNGFLSFITPNTFLVLELGDKLRRFIYENLQVTEIIETLDVFKDAVVETLISFFRKQPSDNNASFNVLTKNRNSNRSTLDSYDKACFSTIELFSKQSLVFNYKATEATKKLFNFIQSVSQPLEKHCKVTAGVILYEKGKGNPKQTEQIMIDKPYTSFKRISDEWVPLVRGTDVRRYELEWSGEYVKYGDCLAAPRNPDNFFKDKIFIRRTDDKLMCVLDEQNMIGVKSVHCVQSIETALSNKLIMALINSKLLNWFFRYDNFHMIGKPLAEVKVVFVERLPIRLPIDQQPFVTKAEIMLFKIRELRNLKQSFLQLLQAKYEGIIISKKLAEWPHLSFKGLLNELEKVKVKIGLAEQVEWLKYFESEQSKATELQNFISQTDNELDNMVYQLYELTAQEIAIVENS